MRHSVFAYLFFIGTVSWAGAMTDRRDWRAAASSSDAAFPPEFAIDVSPETRWGSEFKDDVWWQVDFGKSLDLAGVKILWEAAYAKDYNVLVSLDGSKWETAYELREGDGGLDEIYFNKRLARYLRIAGLRRGTGWGYSLLEVNPVCADELPALEASSALPGHPAANVLDGLLETSWQAHGEGQSLTLEFPQSREVTGVELLWGQKAAKEYSIEMSADGRSWKSVAEVRNSRPGRNLVYFEGFGAKRLRLICRSGLAGDFFELNEIQLRGKGDAWTPVRYYEALQTRVADGLFPRWLNRQQAFWTIVGVPDDIDETLVEEDGAVEPKKGSFSVMPLLIDQGRLKTARDFKVSRRLEGEALPMPTVEWSDQNVCFQISATGAGSADESSTWVRYRVKNLSGDRRKVALALAIRPLQINPPWQYGGASPIRSAGFNEDGSELEINGRRALSCPAPARFGVVSPEREDVCRTLLEEKIGTKSMRDEKGLLSAGLVFDLDLEAGKSGDIVVVFPLHESSPRPALAADEKMDGLFQRTWDEQSAAWKERLEGWKIETPVPKLARLVESNFAYIALNRDNAAPQPGPRNYAKAWMRDGAISATALLRFGQPGEVRHYLEWLMPLVIGEGYVPFLVESDSGRVPEFARDWNEFDSQGEFVYAVRTYYEYSRDKDFLRKAYPAVLKALAYQQMLIDRSKTERLKGTVFYGLLPESNSHEGYFPRMHSYWDDFWALKGLKDGIALAGILGDEEARERLKSEENVFRKDFYDSMRAVVTKGRLDYIPGCAEKGEFDVTSTAIALVACEEMEALLSDKILGPALRASYERYVREVRPRWTGEKWASFTPYEFRNVEALLRLGRRDDAIHLLTFFLGEPVRPAEWNLWAEVVHPDPRTGSYIGDMPHTWVGADFINAARSLFVMEQDERLILNAGVPQAWLDTGVTVELPTAHGRVRYEFQKSRENGYVFRLSGEAKPDGGFVLKHPFGDKVASVLVNGNPASVEELLINALPCTVEFQLKP